MKKNLIWAIVTVLVLVAVGNLLIRGVVNDKAQDLVADGLDQAQQAAEASLREDYTDLSASEAKNLIESNPDLVIIDVSPHYDNGHIPGAINYYPSSALEDAIPTLDKTATYLVYCHADGPSRSGAQKLVDAGLTVYRLDSHYSGWVAAGYDVEM